MRLKLARIPNKSGANNRNSLPCSRITNTGEEFSLVIKFTAFFNLQPLHQY